MSAGKDVATTCGGDVDPDAHEKYALTSGTPTKVTKHV